MKESVFIISIIVIFLIISFFTDIILLKAKRLRFAIICLVYFISAFLLFDAAVTVNQYLSDRKIYLEFGHADEELVEIFLLCIIIAIINILVILFIRGDKTTKEKTNQDINH